MLSLFLVSAFIDASVSSFILESLGLIILALGSQPEYTLASTPIAFHSFSS